MLLTFKINKQLIRRTDCEIPVAKSENYLYAQFTFSDEWEGTKTAIFNNGTPYSVTLDEDNKCLVPWEVITASGFSVSVFCGQRITANVEFVGVLPTGYIEGQTPEPPTPTVYDQIIEELNGKLEPENIIAGDNITITVNGKNVTISSTSGTIDAYTKAETDALLDEKQDTLTAGDGISIINNVISATATSVRTVFTPTKETYLTSEIETGIYDVAGEFVISTGYYYDQHFTVGEGAILVYQNLTQGFFRAIVIGGLDINDRPDVLICGKPDTDSDFVVGYLSTIYYDLIATISDLEDALEGKQNTLTAGSNISIVNDVISAVIDLTNYYTKGETNTLLSGKADTSALATKLDTNQGSANVGKVMTVGADGNLTPQVAQGTTYTAGQNISISAQNVISAGIEVIEI